METRDIKMGNATMNLNNRFVFHHMTTNVTGPDTVNEEGEESEDNTQSTSLPIHEVGRNGDVFPDDAGKLLPANGSISWGAHIHASGLPGSESYSRLHIGFRLHPEGYLPKRQIRGIQFGRSQLQVDGGQANNRDDAYKVLPQAMKIWNYEPHMHANGVRMCLQAIYGRAVETLNCAGYDHNWVRNYIYEENFQPILPKGTILHAVGWFDGTSRNGNLPDPRNTATFGNGSLGNMFIVFNLAEFLTDEEYVEEVKKRKEFMKANPGVEMIGCPACFLPTPDPEPKKPASTNQTSSVPTAAPATGGTN